jgi:hypothetical protein
LRQTIFGLRRLPMTDFARNKNVLDNMIDTDPHSPVNVTKHGTTVCIAMSLDHYMRLLSGAPPDSKETEAAEKVFLDGRPNVKPQAPFR